MKQTGNSREARLKVLRTVTWDYNITPEELCRTLEGGNEAAGHYSRETIFKKMLLNLPWFSICSFFTLAEIRELLSDQLIEQLWRPDLREKYSYVKQRLQEIVPVAG